MGAVSTRDNGGDGYISDYTTDGDNRGNLDYGGYRVNRSDLDHGDMKAVMFIYATGTTETMAMGTTSSRKGGRGYAYICL